MTPLRTVLTLFLTALVLPAMAVAQDEATTENALATNQTSPRELRKELWQAEKDFYSIYNKLNEDALYHVVCSKEASTGTVFKSQVCRPKFLARAIKEGKVGKGTNLETNSDLNHKIATFRSNLETLVAENPELQSAATTLNLAHARVNADEERRAKN